MVLPLSTNNAAFGLPVRRPGPGWESFPEILNPNSITLVEDGRVRVDDVTTLVGVRIVTSAKVCVRACVREGGREARSRSAVRAGVVSIVFVAAGVDVDIDGVDVDDVADDRGCTL